MYVHVHVTSFRYCTRHFSYLHLHVHVHVYTVLHSEWYGIHVHVGHFEEVTVHVHVCVGRILQHATCTCSFQYCTRHFSYLHLHVYTCTPTVPEFLAVKRCGIGNNKYYISGQPIPVSVAGIRKF